jgi:multiple sugar transport system substrate-binding protein
MNRRLSTRRRTTLAALAGTAGMLALAACGGGGFEEDADEPASTSEPGTDLRVLIGSSGDAETAAVKEAVLAWSSESGTGAEVTIASDMNQELSQGFASGEPADVFYVNADVFQGYAANGSLLPYGDDLEARDDFYPSLVEQFTFEDQLYCAPKDFSTLALEINTDDWEAAGLTDADIPTDWASLKTAAEKLTKDGRVGLGFSGEYARVGAFMAQAGGTMTNEDGTQATVNSPENVAGLTYVKELLTSGVAGFAATDLGAGWGGEAFGTNKASMTIEGNWITGAMTNDYPDVKYRVVELPAGEGGKGTLQFTNCWGIAADSKNQPGAIELVEYLISTEQQLAFAEAFGVMPSVQSAADGWKKRYPEMSAFIDSAEYAQNVVNAQGWTDVVTDFNAQLETLETSDPKEILDSVQSNLQAVLDENAQ